MEEGGEVQHARLGGEVTRVRQRNWAYTEGRRRYSMEGGERMIRWHPAPMQSSLRSQDFSTRLLMLPPPWLTFRHRVLTRRFGKYVRHAECATTTGHVVDNAGAEIGMGGWVGGDDEEGDDGC